VVKPASKPLTAIHGMTRAAPSRNASPSMTSHMGRATSAKPTVAGSAISVIRRDCSSAARCRPACPRDS
jgi:hypothetical protein